MSQRLLVRLVRLMVQAVFTAFILAPALWRAFLVAGLLVASVAMSPRVQAHGTVDQEQDVTNATIALASSGSLAQTFVPTADNLSGVDLYLFTSFTSGADYEVTVTIHEGGPTGPQVGPPRVDLVSTTSPELYHFDFPNIPLSPGNPYAIRIVPSSGTHEFFRMQAAHTDPYAQGSLWVCNQQLSCNPVFNNSRDARFRTYSEESVTDVTPCDAHVSEAVSYSLLYHLPIPENANYVGSTPPYTVDNSGSIGSFNRVAYCLLLDGDWVWVSMDAFTNVSAQLGVPVMSTGATFQTLVSNMNVQSNAPSIISDSFPEGNIEFWHNCYERTGAFPPGGDDNSWDFADTSTAPDCYGSMQVHNAYYHHTVFAYNGWNSAFDDDLGIGNRPHQDTDWTLAANAPSYSLRDLYVLVRQETAIELASFDVSATGKSVTLAWETATEVDNAGFNLYWATSVDGEYEQINELTIAAKAEAGAGASYSFTDAVDDGVYFYKLEDVDFDGMRTLHGPVKIIVGGGNIFLPAVQGQ